MKQRSLIVILLLVILAVVGAAIWLVLGSGGGGPAGGDDPAPVETTETPAEAVDRRAPEKTATKRWTRKGPGSLAGKLVEYGTDAPVGGVDIVLEAGLPGPNELLRTTSNADGSFRFTEVTNFDAWTLIASPQPPLAQARLVGVTVVEGQEANVGVIYLTPAFVVPGIVVDERGDPLPDASVQAIRTRSNAAQADYLRLIRELPYPYPAVDEVTTDEDGKFALTKTPPGTYDIRIEKPGYQLKIERQVIITPSAQDRELYFVVQSGFQIHGRVVRNDDGPLEGLPVVAFEEPKDDLEILKMDRRFALTDEKGNFVLDGLGGGEYGVAVVPEGRPIALALRVLVPSRKIIEILVGGDCWIEGTVSDLENQPVAQAGVYVLRFNRNPPMVGHALSDGEGKYRIDGLKSGPVQIFMVQAEGHGDYPGNLMSQLAGGASVMTLQPGQNTKDVTLGAGGTVKGIVIDRNEETPIPGVKISLTSAQAFFGGAKSVLTDAEGRFELTAVPKGTAMIAASKDGWFHPGVTPQTLGMAAMREFAGNATDTGRGPVISVSESGQVIERTIKLVRGSMLRGRVLNPADEPVAGAQISLEFANVSGLLRNLVPLFPLGDARLTDNEGNFEIPGPPPAQDVQVIAKAQGFLDGKSEVFKVAPGEDKGDMVVKLREGATLEGKVTNTEGQPISGAQVRYLTATGNENDWDLSWRLRRAEPSTTLEDGTFRVTQVETGKLVVQIAHPQYLSTSQRSVEAVDGKSVRVDAKLEGGATLRGVVMGPTGKPYAGAEVDVRMESNRPAGVDSLHRNPRDPVTDAKGAFVLEGLVPGKYKLRAEATGSADSDWVFAETGADEPLTLNLKPAYPIKGVVRDGEGTPIAGIRVEAYRKKEDGGRDHVTGERTNPQGEFEIGDLPGGMYDLEFQQGWNIASNRPSVAPKTIEDVEAGTQGLLVELDSGLVIAGTVIGTDGEPLGEGWISCNRVPGQDEDNSPNVNTGSSILEGEFRITGLIPGKYQLYVYAEGGTARQMVVDAPKDSLRIELGGGATVRGRVTLEDGTPAAGAGVSLENVTTGDRFNGQAKDNGEYEITGVTAGTYTVSSWHGSNPNFHHGSRADVDVPDNGSATADISLEKAEVVSEE